MNRNLLKRVGMLTAATAICTAGAFGALALNGLRYMRPTADNWWLLPYAEPADRVEQAVIRYGESGVDRIIAGYDTQDRVLWSCSMTGMPPSIGRVRNVYTGNTGANYSVGHGCTPNSYWKFDEQGRRTKMEIGDETTTYFYRGDKKEPYLRESHNAQGILTDRSVAETDAKNGNTIQTVETFEDSGASAGTMRYTIDTHGNVIKSEMINVDGTTETYVCQWSYDDTARTATRVNESDGTIEHYQYDEQGRCISQNWTDSLGAQWEYTTTYTDVTR